MVSSINSISFPARKYSLHSDFGDMSAQEYMKGSKIRARVFTYLQLGATALSSGQNKQATKMFAQAQDEAKGNEKHFLYSVTNFITALETSGKDALNDFNTLMSAHVELKAKEKMTEAIKTLG